MDNEILAKLKKIPLFGEIKENDEQIAQFESICGTRSVRSGEVIIKEGERGSEMFIMLKGRVTIQRQTRAGDDYTVVNLRAEDNVFFGEMALIDDDTRSATIVAAEDSEFLIVTKEDFAKGIGQLLHEDNMNLSILVGRPWRIKKEWRIFVRKGEAITGSQYRKDFPETDDKNFASHIELSRSL